jgi:hypothetical protein
MSCDKSCKTAQSKKCTCSCDGANHGRQLQFGQTYECEQCEDQIPIDEVDFTTLPATDEAPYDAYIVTICQECAETFDIGLINTTDCLSHEQAHA